MLKKTYRRDEAEFITELAMQKRRKGQANDPVWIANNALEIIRLTNSYRALTLLACNQELTARQVKRQKKIESMLTCIASALNCKGIVFSTDPRGVGVMLLLRNGHTNDWNHEGYCVPSRSL